MFCRKCGADNNDDALFCTKCGERMNYAVEVKEEKNKAAFVLSIISVATGSAALFLTVMCCTISYAIYPGLAALVCGIIARKKGDKSVMSMLGIIFGSVGIVGTVVFGIVYTFSYFGILMNTLGSTFETFDGAHYI